MTPQTRMFIGSQSKSFTALAVAQLAEQGKLDLNAPVQTYIPWFRVADEDASARITLNHLLHHTSGLSESGYGVLLPADASAEQAVRSLAQARLTEPVGTRHQYFNVGYDVLAYIIETVSGEPYADYLQAHIFGPLGMARSTAAPSTVNDVAQGYSRFFGFAIPVRQPVRTYEIGAGYIVSTAEDLARYAIALLQAGGGLVTPQMAQRIFTPGLSDYGMGWIIARDGSKIWHGGANEAFRTDVNLYPRAGRAFVLLVNEGHLVDHYISSAQLTAAVEAFVLGYPPAPASQGPSVRAIGWALGALVLGLIALHTVNFLRLRSWCKRARGMTPARKAFDIAVSFIIPTVILIIIFSRMRAFFGYRFDLGTNLVMMRYSLPDVFVLMLVGTIPDYVQGGLKWLWALRGRRNGNILAQ
jgi:CubicO group peptidase (beta-lactamase class C family)